MDRLDHKTLEAMRRMAVERGREGEPAAKVIVADVFNRTTIDKGLQAAIAGPWRSYPALHTRHGAAAHLVTPRQESQVLR